MILFSTILPTHKKLTAEDFIRLVIEWNNTNDRHGKANMIPGIVWNGERSIRYGKEALWLQIEEYPAKNIIAVRYEKKEKDGAVWDTDYVLNLDEKRICVRLDRSYTEEALSVAPGFSTPHFISMLAEGGYLVDDGKLPTHNLPILLDETNVSFLDGVADRTAGYRLPIVYISKTRSGEDPVDVGKLASRLKGAAHVLVEADAALNDAVSEKLGQADVRDGSVIVIYPNEKAGQKKFTYSAYKGKDKMFADRITRCVIEYSNAQMTDSLYTWQGVNNALLRDALHVRGEELEASKKKEQESNELMEYAVEDYEKLKPKMEELTLMNERLLYENQGLRARLGSTAGEPVLYLGEEEEFYKDEIRAILVETLEGALEMQLYEGSRRYDVIKDLVEHNPCEHTSAEKINQLKSALAGYRNVTGSIRQCFADLGIEIREGGKHYELALNGDNRYVVTISKTPSSSRSGENAVGEIKKVMF